MVPITANGDEIGLSNKEAGEELESVGVKEENAQLNLIRMKRKLKRRMGRKWSGSSLVGGDYYASDNNIWCDLSYKKNLSW